MKRLARFAAVVLASAGMAAGQLQITAVERSLDIESFEEVWKTVRDKHWDPRLGGLDWQAVHDEQRAKLDRAANRAEARAALSEMLARLKQTHFNIIPAEAYQEMDSSSAHGASPGIDVRVIDGHALVTSVDPDSPAAARAVKPGLEIVRVDGKDVAPSLRKIQESFGQSTLLDIMLSRAVTSRLSGSAGQAVRVDLVDGNGRTVQLNLNRVPARGAEARLGYMPAMNFWVESRKVGPDIGYVRFNMFMDPEKLIGAFRKMVTECRGCAGFVIDLRGNPGGIGGLAGGVAGWFIDQPDQKLGVMTLRDTSIKFVVFPRPEPFRGPLAVLVDGCSGSTSEIFAGGLKDLKRARIFGTRTAGAALPSVFEKLPNGDGFQYAIANYVSQGGRPLEGLGVVPDEEVKLTRRQLLEGRDPALEAAVTWIQKLKN